MYRSHRRKGAMVTTARLAASEPATAASAEAAGSSGDAEAPAVPAATGAGLGRKEAKRKCKKEEQAVEREPRQLLKSLLTMP
jgi:hypothetical protein